jgi:hypothetical protein
MVRSQCSMLRSHRAALRSLRSTVRSLRSIVRNVRSILRSHRAIDRSSRSNAQKPATRSITAISAHFLPHPVQSIPKTGQFFHPDS